MTQSEQRGAGPQVSPWEKVVAALGALLVAGMLGFLGQQAMAGDRSPPALRLRVQEVREAGGGFLVRFAVQNEGGSAAADVSVRGELAAGGAGQAPEASEAVLDYVPGHSERSGGLFFRADPRTRALELRALGYQDP